MPTQKMVSKLLDRDYVFRGVIYEFGIRDVPEDFEHGTVVGEPSSGAALSAASARLLVGLDDEQLRAALELRGITADPGATRSDMLRLVGLVDAPRMQPAGAPAGGSPAGASGGSASGGSEAVDYEGAWNKDELLEEAEKRGLTVSGSGKDGNVLKSDLVAALQADDAAAAAAKAPAAGA
jgi:hypothetical protein